MHFLYSKDYFSYYRRMKKCFGLLVAVLAVLFIPLCDIYAGEISLSIRSGSTFKDGNVILSTEISNEGDTAAYNIWIEGDLSGNKGRSEEYTRLSQDDFYKDSVLLGPQPEMPGIYTIIIKVHYEDFAGNPFSVLSYIPFISSMPDDLNEPVNAKVDDISIRRKQDAVLLLSKSQSVTTELPVKLRFIFPDELKCNVSERDLILGEKEEAAAFDVYNHGTVAGSVYSYYVVVDYEKDGLHRSFPVRGIIRILPLSIWPLVIRYAAISLVGIIALLLVSVNFAGAGRGIPACMDKIPYLNKLILGAILLFVALQLQPEYWLMNTLSVGGDVPAHNYLASHLKEQLFQHGRIISWSHGWWCGFPVFQYYFCLPYLIIALLDLVLPFNVAFKLVSVLGVLALPASVYFGVKKMGTPKYTPIVAATMMVPFLFVRINVMWGANAYSTLAGMISNSLSFPLMVLFVASAYCDSNEGRFRLRSVVLFVLLISSHFFTSIIAGLTVLIFPLLKPDAGIRKSFVTLAQEALLGLALMAWWIVPLIAKSGFSAEFGINWEVPLLELVETFPYLSVLGFPAYSLLLLPFALYGLYRGARSGSRFLIVCVWMLLISTFLYVLGFNWVAHVFVNVRLWPFMFYAFLLIVAYGIGCFFDNVKGSGMACVLVLLIALLFGVEQPNEVDDWAKWNYEGLENKRSYSVFKELVLPLDGTPGRLANDLHDDNDGSLGSSRIFELVPHLIAKPILEGGIVNSAIGSIYSYYVQGETSEECAGFPTIVEPTTFNITNATRHLELLNVKHFIARWEITKNAMRNAPEWRFIKRTSEWELYELTTHDGSYVTIPENYPLSLRVENWQQAGLDWIYNTENLDQLYILADYEAELPEGVAEVDEMNEHQRIPVGDEERNITITEYSSERIVFDTDGVGLPHLIKCTYFPNWKMKGGGDVYMVTPCFMLVYPQSEHVELYYASLFSDTAGRSITLIAFIFIVFYLAKRACHVSSKQSA